MDLSMLPDFIIEAVEHLEDMEDSLLKLEQDQTQGTEDVLNEIFRAIHSIKGAAQYIGLERVSELSHKLESLMDLVRQGKKQLNQNIIDLFIAARDRIALLVNELDRNQSEESEVDDLFLRIKDILNESPEDEQPGRTGEINDVIASGVIDESDRLENETLDEDDDHELLDIFLQQLKENISFLQTLVAELAASVDKEPVLKRCRDTIKSLFSSANYMGYEQLCAYYNAWQLEIDSAEESGSESAESGDDFMQRYLDGIILAYPEIAATDTSQAQGEHPEQEQKDDCIASCSGDADLDENIDGFFGDLLEDSPASEQQNAPPPADDETDEVLAALSDAFDEYAIDETTDTSPPAEKQFKLTNETLDEVYDEELLNIFNQQLQENAGFLQTQIAELDTSVDKVAVLKRCGDTIRSLLSSANYMGYEMLCDHYNTWQTEIVNAEQEISSGGELPLDFMQNHLDEVLSAYPQATAAMEQFQNESSQKEYEGDFVANVSGEDTLGEDVDALFGDLLDESPASMQNTDIPASEESGTDAGGLSAALSDAFDETTDTPSSRQKTGQLLNEALDENFDEELLNIFMRQLKENIGFLQTQIVALDTSVDKMAVLDRCKDTLKGLFSSASYMGYDMLSEFYRTWQTELDTAQQGVSSGEETGLGFMQAHLDEIVRVYFENATDKENQQSKISLHEQPEESVDSSDHDNLGEALDTLFSDIPREEDPALHESSTPAADDTTSVAQISDTVSEDSKLFGKLQDALECSLDEKKNVPEQLIHGVIEEMISCPDEDVTSEQSSTKEKISEAETRPDFSPPVDKDDTITSSPQQKRVKTEESSVDSQPVSRRSQKTTNAGSVKQTMRVDVVKIDYLMNQVGELVVSRSYFSQLFNEIKALHQGLLETTGLTKKELKPLNEFSFRLGEAGVALGRVSNELQEAVMKVRMLPVSQLFKRYPRLVRDLVHSTDKQVNLELRGETTELDKMVIEAISDPLIHIIRNAIDHGIETASRRKQLGKPEKGTLILEAYHESNHIVIEVTDDGRGIDPERIRDKALKKRLYSEEELERMGPLELTRLVMVPGFSTAEKATKTSGRGVGMDVVKRNIEKLNGTIDIQSTVGQQTQMRIKIPLTMAIIQALMVRVDREIFTIPLTTVEETLRIFPHDISVIEGVEVIHLRNATMPIFRLSSLFNMRKSSSYGEEDKFFVVVVSTGMQEVGLVVDELLGQEEVVIKPLAEYLRVDSGFSGATIIGGGAISLILDIPELIKMTLEQQVSKQKSLTFERKTPGARIPTRQTPHTIH